jgi:hypothetical protein
LMWADSVAKFWNGMWAASVAEFWNWCGLILWLSSGIDVGWFCGWVLELMWAEFWSQINGHQIRAGVFSKVSIIIYVWQCWTGVHSGGSIPVADSVVLQILPYLSI